MAILGVNIGYVLGFSPGLLSLWQSCMVSAVEVDALQAPLCTLHRDKVKGRYSLLWSATRKPSTYASGAQRNIEKDS
ncbi:hypothetical protein RB195_001031 [Necator americanus]|uniref:Uncharacterized protein n=1 Tax=Necator americanus TaxID=51031 RepID=A0ABR1DCE9_NECAM